MQQVARNLTDCGEGFLTGVHYLIHDRDPLYTEAFRALLKRSDVKTVKLPARSPNLNAYAERFVRPVITEGPRDGGPSFGTERGLAPIQVNSTDYHLSDIAENPASIAYSLNLKTK
jgi:transposase InsO family protein